MSYLPLADFAGMGVFGLYPGEDGAMVLPCADSGSPGGIVNEAADAGVPVPARERRGHRVRSCGGQHQEARRSAGCRRERVWHAAADVHQAAFADRGHMAVGVHQQFPGHDEEDLIAGGVDMQRRPAGCRRDGAGDNGGSAGRGRWPG